MCEFLPYLYVRAVSSVNMSTLDASAPSLENVTSVTVLVGAGSLSLFTLAEAPRSLEKKYIMGSCGSLYTTEHAQDRRVYYKASICSPCFV